MPGVTCAFLGPADMALSLGLHESYAYDLGAAMSSSEMKQAEAQLLAVGR